MNNIQVYLNTLQQKGYLAYEYNPLHNYQTDVDLYLINNKYLVPKGMAVNPKNGELLTQQKEKWVDKRGRIIEDAIDTTNPDEANLYATAGTLIDFETDKLNFDLEHPVDITVQPSYDGSVNLILNDDKNIPRLINSRFSVREKGTYEIIDRIGENDTNIYNSKTFDKDTSLYFQYEQNPTISFEGYVNGVLPVGQYCFYFTYCDADDNESDYIAETGLIPVFIGSDGNATSMDGGIKNQSSTKGIKLKLKNLDKAYNYLRVYYVRYFADYQQNRVYECKKLYHKYYINSSILNLQITGNEQAENIDANILNLSRFNPKSVLTQAQCKNMLFFGNIVQNKDNYKELQDCALRIIPRVHEQTISQVDMESYYGKYELDSKGYYYSKNIYNNTGYFPQEYYRFGVVFIYQNGTLSNVYNTLGCILNNADPTGDISYTSGTLFTTEGAYLNRNYLSVDNDNWITNAGEFFKDITTTHLNARGVCLINVKPTEQDTILGIKFEIPEEVVKFLKEDLGIRGAFFVRQKCIPNILAQCYLMPMDEVLKAPVLEIKKDDKSEYITETFLGQSYTGNDRVLTNVYYPRLYKYKNNEDEHESPISEHAYAAICPDFLLNQPYYNQIFNGSDFKIQKITKDSNLTNNGISRYYIENNNFKYEYSSVLNKVTICSVTDDVPSVALKDKVFKLVKGATEEVIRFEMAEYDSGVYSAGNDDKDGKPKEMEKLKKASNLVRGKYSPFLAIYSDSKLETGALYNIYQNLDTPIKEEFQIRMNSREPFYAISDRYNFEQFPQLYSLVCWRGDCYLNTFTYRLSRNFNDPTLANNDVIIDRDSWKNNYSPLDNSKWKKISRSDVNAVQIGSWITFRVKSAMNYALRSEDNSYVSEKALMGSPRSFFPRKSVMWRGNHKMPDSYLYNDAYRATLGFKCYFPLQDMNYIKNVFSNRIQYSAISVQDSYKNNYRYSLSTYFRDYSAEYGSIIKLVGFEGHLLVVFEHAIGLAPINERILAGQGEGEPVFINTKNVLPEELTIITDTYGTQWGESVVKSEQGYVYGVDTIAKKIWRIVGQQFEILSDLKVGKFLIDNISLGERETSPIIGLRNVKTHYNNNKKDIMFTFYDDVYKDEEKVWNLCFNEILGEFVTFYSWVPSYSENIDTQFFTFNRNTSKGLTLLGKCNYSVPENTGVLVDTPILSRKIRDQYLSSEVPIESEVPYVDPDPEPTIPDQPVVPILQAIVKEYVYFDSKGNRHDSTKPYYSLTPEDEEYNWTPKLKDTYIDHYNSNIYYTKPIYNKVWTSGDSEKTIHYDRRYELADVSFKLEKDHWGNYKLFDITTDNVLTARKDDNVKEAIAEQGGILYLEVTPYKGNPEDLPIYPDDTTLFKTETIALTIPKEDYDEGVDKDKILTTDFYIHGQAGNFDIKETIYPCKWYDKVHPFEFEFVINDNLGVQKIFNNLLIVSNKAEPESFHFEIEGDNYEFSPDKRTMYFRQEATKELFQNSGSNMLFNRNYKDIKAYTKEQWYRTPDSIIKSEDGTTNFRYYPEEKEGLVQQYKSTIFPLYYERIDTFDDIYHKYQEMNCDGMDFQNLSGSEIVWNRDLNQFNIVTHIKNSPIEHYGRIRGNSYYKEGRWNIQIPTIVFNQKNELEWTNTDKFTNNPIPPIVINSQNIPEDMPTDQISLDKIPNIYTGNDSYPYVEVGDWDTRKEAKIRDKWMKVRIRYSGNNLAIIHSISTIYNNS